MAAHNPNTASRHPNHEPHHARHSTVGALSSSAAWLSVSPGPLPITSGRRSPARRPELAADPRHPRRRAASPTTFLLKALAIVVWITWALLVASLIAEGIGVVRGKSARDVPLTGPFQPIARWLVAAIAVGILTTSTRPTGTPPTALAASLTSLGTTSPRVELVIDVTGPPPATHVVANNGTVEPTVAPQPTVYVVQPGDTLWDISQRHLGDPYRWPEIYDLSQGQPQPDGISRHGRPAAAWCRLGGSQRLL